VAKKAALDNPHVVEANPVEQAFGAARSFLENLAMVAQHAREYRPSADKPDAWQDVAFNFAEAFIAWDALTPLLSPAVRTEARRVYPPGAAVIKISVSNQVGPVVPTMPAKVESLLTKYRRVTLGATPYPTVIEAVADELGVYFRNAVYPDRRHPLEPDRDRLIGEAKALATERQVAQGKPAEPMGWGADLSELEAKETRAVVLARLGIKTYGDIQDLMMHEWNAQDRARGEWVLNLLRCDPINFSDLRIQLIREAEAVIAAAGKPSGREIDPAVLERLDAALVEYRAGFERIAGAIGSMGTHDSDRQASDPTMRDLATEAGISDDTFRRVRLAAGIKVNLKGAAARNRRYGRSEVDLLIAAALAGNFIERTAMSKKWAKWGSE